jgi:membrane protease YdiL (CAAX protease family)
MLNADGSITMVHLLPYLILVLIPLVDIGVIIVWAVHEDRLTRNAKPLLAARWSLAEIFLGAQAALLLSLLPTATVAMVFFATGPLGTRPNGEWFTRNPVAQIVIIIVFALSFYGAQVGLVDFFIRLRYKLRWADIGFGSKVTWGQLAAGVGAGLSLMAISVPISFLTERAIGAWKGNQYLEHLKHATGSGSLERLVHQAPMNWGLVAGVLVLTTLVAPLAEELVFRGLVFNSLRHRLGLWAGAIISGLAFAAVHGSVLQLPAIWLMGVLLALVYSKTGSLWSSIVAHGVNNFLATVILFSGRMN